MVSLSALTCKMAANPLPLQDCCRNNTCEAPPVPTDQLGGPKMNAKVMLTIRTEGGHGENANSQGQEVGGKVLYNVFNLGVCVMEQGRDSNQAKLPTPTPAQVWH